MNRNVFKGLGIGFFIILLSLLAMYLGLARYYSDGFSYETWINGIYCTGKGIEEVNEELLKQCDYAGLTIIDSDGKSYVVSTEDVDFHFDFKNALTLFLKQQNPYLWIDNLIGGKKDRVLEPDVWYDKDVYEGIINGFPFFERLEESVGRLEIIKGETGYSLLNERLHILNEERARETIKKALSLSLIWRLPAATRTFR